MSKFRKSDEWISMASRSRPGRSYLFNKSTGETKWLPLLQEHIPIEKQKESPPKLLISPKSRTPAQDRLKRLQYNLKAGQLKPCVSNATHHAASFKVKTSERQENEIKDEPTISYTSEQISSSVKKVSNRIDLRNVMVESGKTSEGQKNFIKDEPRISSIAMRISTSTKRTAKHNDFPNEMVRAVKSSERQDNEIKDEPSISSIVKRISTSTKKAAKLVDFPNEMVRAAKTSERQDNVIKDEPSISSRAKCISTSTKSAAKHDVSKEVAACAKTSERQENEIKDEPSISFRAKRDLTSAKKLAKRIGLTNDIIEPTLDNPKKMRFSDSLNDAASTSMSNGSITLETCTKPSQYSQELVSNNIPENLQNIEDNSSKLSKIRGIVKKIKEICTIPFGITKKLTNDKLDAYNWKSSSLSNTTKFKATTKTKTKQCLSRAGTQVIVKQIISEKGQSAEIENIELKTAKNLNIPSYPRGSANSRLERLKQSLISQQNEQQQSCTTKNNGDILNKSSHFSFGSKENKVTSLQTGASLTINSSYKSANNEIEAMDWQPIGVYEEPVKTSSSESTLVVEKSRKFLLQKNNSDEDQTMGDIIDTVNENLLRFSAEKQTDSTANKNKWRKDFYYFIVDTNVLLRDLTFVDDLSKMKLCDTKGSMLYIPYSVLQELDKLKIRFGPHEGVKTLTVRAIKYLNSKFENNSPNLQAQSALDERHHLIDISSADDSIINCCLQAKKHVSNIILLTEDVNLRNKAICNNIIVSTKSNLLAKRYNSSDES